MATQKITPIAVVPQSLPAVETVTQDRLVAIIRLRQQAEVIESQLADAEREVKSALESGAEVESGILHACLKTTERRNVSWKAVVERKLGEAYARRVLAATRPDVSTRLIVEA